MQILKKGALLGQGLTADVLAWDDNRVLKLFFDWFPACKADDEFNITRALHAAGLPVPAACEQVEIEGRSGILFERIDGLSMLAAVERKPWKLFSAARLLAELHAQLHNSAAPPELPSQRGQIQNWINLARDLTPDEKHAAEVSLAQIPEGNSVCHGDFHPGNILFAARGPIIIDWLSGARGHPLADVARTSRLMLEANLPEGSPLHLRLLLGISRALLHAAYLRRYFQLRPGGRAHLELYRPAQLAASSAWRCSKML